MPSGMSAVNALLNLIIESKLASFIEPTFKLSGTLNYVRMLSEWQVHTIQIHTHNTTLTIMH